MHLRHIFVTGDYHIACDIY